MRVRSDWLLCGVATLLIAATFFVAAAGKILWPMSSVSMIDRYLPSRESVRAIGLIEAGIALWLISFRTPRWAAAFAGLVLAVFTILIALELSRTQPLPCGCLPTSPGAMDPFAVRRGLWISGGRNVFLIGMCALSAWLTPVPTGTASPPGGSKGSL